MSIRIEDELLFISKSILNSGIFIFFVLILSQASFAQQPEKRIPDGTEGEYFKAPDTTTSKRKFTSWNQYDGPVSTVKFGFAFLGDAATFVQDKASADQFDMKPGFKVRDFRVLLSGNFKFKRTISWKAGIMYDGTTDRWLFRESGFTISTPEIWGQIFIGRTKEGFSMSKVMNGYAGWMMERQMAIDIIPILGDGIKWMAYLPKQRIFWNVGGFGNWLSEHESFSTYKWQTIIRAGWLPIYTDNKVIHIGASARYGEVENGQLQVRSRPEITLAPFFLDAGTIMTNYTTHFGGELYYRTGPLMMGTEYYMHKIHSPVSGNPLFNGGEVFVSYIFTKETRSYNTATAIFGFINTKSIFKGGHGTFEGILRFSTLDLNKGAITGGAFWRITPQVNWYLSNNLRLEFAYGYGVLDRFGTKGGTNFFQTRIQIMI